MRSDMSKVVTEAPRRGHSNKNEKHGWRLTHDEIDRASDDEMDYGPSWQPWSRHRNYDPKEFSDVLGPLRGYLKKQVGRPWNDVWSELSETLDKRTVTGKHIFDHVKWEVQQDCWMGVSGTVYRRQYNNLPVAGLYVHPMTHRLAYAPEFRWKSSPFYRMRQTLSAFGISVKDDSDASRYRVDGTTIWEHRSAGWFITRYRLVPESRVNVTTPEDTRERFIITLEHYEIVHVKQASRKEIRDAADLLASSHGVEETLAAHSR